MSIEDGFMVRRSRGDLDVLQGNTLEREAETVRVRAVDRLPGENADGQRTEVIEPFERLKERPGQDLALLVEQVPATDEPHRDDERRPHRGPLAP